MAAKKECGGGNERGGGRRLARRGEGGRAAVDSWAPRSRAEIGPGPELVSIRIGHQTRCISFRPFSLCHWLASHLACHAAGGRTENTLDPSRLLLEPSKNIQQQLSVRST